MSSQPPVVSADFRVFQSNLSDEEVAFVRDLIQFARNQVARLPGWSIAGTAQHCATFCTAADMRGIKDGVKTVTQTVDLRS